VDNIRRRRSEVSCKSRASDNYILPLLTLFIGQRTAWLPFFDNVNAIIFLAPISCFDERLSEDPRVNRLRDSFLLWRAICSSKLLAKTTMIIFLNKCDILQKKLEAGIKVSDSLPSYGERPNERGSVIKCTFSPFFSFLTGFEINCLLSA
jgi:hypothetical protein